MRKDEEELLGEELAGASPRDWKTKTRGRTRKKEKERERKRERREGRENVRKIDCENSRDTSLYVEIPVLDECTTIFAIASDCRSRGKCFQDKY